MERVHRWERTVLPAQLRTVTVRERTVLPARAESPGNPRKGFMRYVLLWAVPLFLASCSTDSNGKNDSAGGDSAPETVAADAVTEVQPFEVSAELVPDSDIGQDLDAGPDHAFFHKMTAQPLVSALDTYWIDEPVQYRTLEQLPSLSVSALSAAGGVIWAGCAGGLYRWVPDEDRFAAVELPQVTGDGVVDLAGQMDDAGRLAVVFATRLVLLEPDGGSVVEAEAGQVELSCVAVDGGDVFVGTAASGLYRLESDGPDAILVEVDLGLPSVGVRDLAFDAAGVLWMATPAGVHSWDGETVEQFDLAGGYLADDDVTCVAAVPDGGGVVAGTATGIALLAGDDSQVAVAGVGSIPTAGVLSVAVGERLILGHETGASGLEDPFKDGKVFSRLDHWVSGRWLPDNRVVAAVVDDEDSVWLGTPAGVTRIRWVSHTLQEKAEFFEELQGAHFWRMDGFVPSDIVMDDPWTPTQYHQYDHDNDGLWTQMQVGAWCYAYAATGDEAWYEKARKAMDVMFLQIDVPALTFEAAGMERGFVTRSLVREDEGSVYESKIPQSNWHQQDYAGVSYYWKDDTSSDETTGHFFGYPLFYDLCAKTDEERAEVAAHASALARYIVDGGFRLLDLDGNKTAHGHWHPEQIGAAAFGMDACLEKAAGAENMVEDVSFCLESWHGGGWLNATEILGHLLAAWHMTGEQQFYDAYEMLLDEHGYGNLVVPHEETFTVTDPSFMNHSDHELAMLAYHTLIRYEPDPQRREKWIEGLLFLYERELGERNPLWAAFVSLLAGAEHAELEAALQSLREMPFDRRDFAVDNTHRMDAEDWPDDRFDDPQFDRVFPYDEIKTVWWNSNFREKSGGGSPSAVSGPMAWLLPYWGLRYGGAIAP